MDDENFDSEAYAEEILTDLREKGGRFRLVNTVRCLLCNHGGRKRGRSALMMLAATPEGHVAAVFPWGYGHSGSSEPSDGPVRAQKLAADSVVLEHPGSRARHSACCRTCLARSLVFLEWKPEGIEVEVIPAKGVTFGRVVDR